MNIIIISLGNLNAFVTIPGVRLEVAMGSRAFRPAPNEWGNGTRKEIITTTVTLQACSREHQSCNVERAGHIACQKGLWCFNPTGGAMIALATRQWPVIPRLPNVMSAMVSAVQHTDH